MSSQQKTYVRGIVVVENGGAPQEGVTVEVVLGSGRRSTSLGRAVTNAKGRFELQLSEGPLSRRSGPLRFAVSRERRPVELAHGSPVVLDLKRLSKDVVLCVRPGERCPLPTEIELQPSELSNRYVFGVVQHEDGTRLEGLQVKIFLVTLNGAVAITTTAITDAEGAYQINDDALASGVNVIVRAYADENEDEVYETLVGSSRMSLQIDPNPRIDVLVRAEDYAGPSEYQRIGGVIEQARADVASPPAVVALTHAQVMYIAARYNVSASKVTDYVFAHRMAGETGMADYKEQIYALFQAGWPRSISQFLSSSRAAARTAVFGASRRNVISSGAFDVVDDFLQAWVDELVRRALDPESAASMGSVLTAAGLSGAESELLLGLWLAHTGKTSAFWDAIEAHVTLGAKAADIQAALSLSLVVASHAPMVGRILELVTDISEIASWSSDDWSDRIADTWSGDPVGVPEGMTEATYITHIQEKIEEAFPSASSRREALADTDPELADLRTYLTANSGFSFGGAAATGSSDEARMARKFQRMYRVAPSAGRYTAMKALAADFSSARDIDRMGRARFVQSYTSSLGSADAALEVYQRARALSSMAAVAYTMLHPNLYGPTYAAQIAREEPSDLPNYESLFGETDSCGCDPCLSVHSPAAYLVDLLDWVDERGGWAEPEELEPEASPAPSARKLNVRRRDLGQLALTCENTWRVLPYVDLVNEVLEVAVASHVHAEDDPPWTPTYATETSLQDAELLVTPEHVLSEAYDALGEGQYGHRMPFHLWNALSRTFLDHLGAPRWRMLRVFQHNNIGSGEETGITDGMIAAEELRLSATDLSLITEASPDDVELESTPLSVPRRWGVETLAEVAVVKTLMRRAGITWEELLEILHTTTANPEVGEGRTLYLVYGDPCDLDQITLSTDSEVATTPGDEEFRRLSRFIRLWRAHGGSPLEAHRTLSSLGLSDAEDADAALMTQLGGLVRLERVSGMERRLLRVLWSDLDTFEDREAAKTPQRSLYATLFLDPTTFPEAATSSESWLFTLTAGGEPNTSDALSEHLGKLAAALRCEVGAVEDAIAWAYPSTTATEVITLASLSRVVRRVLLARAARCTVGQMEALIALSGLDPLAWESAGSPDLEGVADLLEQVGELRASLGLDLVLWLSTHRAASVARVAPSDEALREQLGVLRDHLRSVAGDYDCSDEVADDATGARFQAALMAALGLEGTAPEWTGTLLELVIGDWISDPDPDLATEQAERWTWITTPASTGDVALADWLDLRDLRAQLIGTGGEAPPLTDAAARCTYALRLLTWGVYRAVRRAALRSAVLEKLGAALGRSQTSVTRLCTLDLSALFAGYAGSNPSLAELFLTRSFLAFEDMEDADRTADLYESGDTLATPIDDVLALLPRLVKMARLLSGLGLDAEEEGWWFGEEGATSAESFGLVDLTGFSLTEDDEDASTRFAGILAAIRLFRQRSRLPGNEPGFASLLGLIGAEDSAPSGTQVSLFLAGLAERCDWREADLQALASAFGYDDGEPALTDPLELERLLDAAELCRRLGLDAATLLGELQRSPVSTLAFDAREDEARAVMGAARARTPDTDAWLAAAKPLRNQVREAQRAALVGYLIDHPDMAFQDEDDLYEYYLMDVQMSPCMLTSRIVQATLSVQQYVQRNLLGLPHPTETEVVESEEVPVIEDALSLTDDDREEWEWMKNYRVWEAARKVFLYPENWIEPELRDDKTPLFETLESDLAQGELDEDRVDEAAIGYLERLREVHNLAVLGYTWQQDESDGELTEALHVIARTRGAPRVYYYRRWEDQATWTPWRKIDCGMEGDHILPVMYNRRLLVFWLSFEEVGDTSDESGSQWYELRLSWSEHRDGAWTPRRVSDPAVSLQMTESPHDVQGQYNLHSELSDNKLLVHVVNRTDAHTLLCFAMDPCTLELSSEPEEGEFEDQRPLTLVPYMQGYVSSVYNHTSALSMPASDLSSTGTLGDTVADYTLLEEPPSDFRVIVSRQVENFSCQTPFFYEDATRNLFVRYVPASDAGLAGSMQAGGFSLSSFGNFLATEAETSLPSDAIGDDAEYDYALDVHDEAAAMVKRAYLAFEAYTGNPVATSGGLFRFEPFYHPYVCTFTTEVRRNGIFGLLAPAEEGSTAELARQQIEDSAWFSTYEPTVHVDPDYPIDEVDFSEGGAYAQYNWELFLHLPMYLGKRLSADQRFQEAMDWYHTVFDPRSQNTDYDTPARYWKIKPFLETIGPSVTDWASFTGADGDENQLAEFEAQVAAWREDPFNPHLLARLRHGTYQKAVFMAYLDNLIAWGDHLFRLDTMESVGEATQLYVLASQLLGERPVTLAAETKPTPKSYDDVRGELDAFSNVLVEVENTLPTPSGSGFRRFGAPTPSVGRTAYFCVPPNARLLAWWDTVADRLFKIRHCLNIEGVARSLSLFAPPIDPALLVRARAAGLDLQTALSASGDSLPNHRYSVLSARASTLAGTVRALGGALQGALERRDAEALALLRSEHELALMDAVGGIKEQAVAEAEANLDAAKKSLKLAEARWEHYDGLLSRELIGQEKAQRALAISALALTPLPIGFTGLKGIFGLLPQLIVGLGAGTEFGGEQAAKKAEAAAQGLSTLIGSLNSASGLAGLGASFARRQEDWKFQRKLAKKEQNQINQQILAAEIRLDMARRDLSNHKLQRSQSVEVDQWMRGKFTSKELYDWMVSQVSGLYFASYTLALDLARQAERAFRHELGLSASSFVAAGHWDSLKKGLLAGERLSHELERLDAAYLAQDTREYELTKHVSLSSLDPLSLALLRETGECWVDLPESLFDLDCPGHYFRRLSAVTLSLACLSGPQANVHVELTLYSSRMRREPDASADLVEDSAVGVTRIVTSTARDDGGLFQLDLRDPRYLPFERRGAASTWRVRLCNPDWPQLDRDSITDLTLHLRYTAREGGEDFRSDVLAGLGGALAIVGGQGVGTSVPGEETRNGLFVALSAVRDDPDAWHLAHTEGSATLNFTVGAARKPAFTEGRTVTLSRVFVLAPGLASGRAATLTHSGTATTGSLNFASWTQSGTTLQIADCAAPSSAWPDTVSVALTTSGVTWEEASDGVLVLVYTVS